MDKKKSEEEIVLDALCNDEDFYSKAWSYAVYHRKKKQIQQPVSTVELLIEEEYAKLSRLFDISGLQESCSVRNVLRTRALAQLFIDDKGDILYDDISLAIKFLKRHLYSLGPQRQHDGKRQEHLLYALETLVGDKSIQQLFKRINRPIGNRNLEIILCETLNLPITTPINDALTRKAVLAAWLCYLRQNVGSCFATAPAILAHDEDPKIFLQDIYDLIATGRITRIFSGLEYSAPLSTSWGAGDLKRQFVLSFDINAEQQPWISPSFLAAMEAVAIFSQMEENISQSEYLKQIIAEMTKEWVTPYPFIITSVEELFRKILLRHYRLNEADITEYMNRPRSMVLNNLLLYVPQMGSKKFNKAEACEQFQAAFEISKSVFKQYSDNALLKAWEFTVASFAETRPTFSSWNFHTSLGLNTDEEGGIGEKLYELCKEKLDYYNALAHEHNEEYERLYEQVKYLETRIRTSTTEQEAKWIKVELQGRLNELNSIQEMRDKASNKAQGFANLYNLLHETYTDLFPQYFQEIYDADLHEVTSGLYDDSPAGFRLIYKHGRTNASLWTVIHGPQEFIDALVNFFIATEREIVDSPYLKPVKDELSAIITSLVMHLKSEKFLKTAFWRMARHHNAPLIQDPLNNLEKIEKKPWVYTSGGSMSSLVSCYFRLPQNPSVNSRWVENTAELLVFLADSAKSLPYKWQQHFRKNSSSSMLMHSPTHAFTLKPGFPSFREAWEIDAFTYTSIRDQFIIPSQQFIRSILLDKEKIDHLLDLLSKKMPKKIQGDFKDIFRRNDALMHSYEFRSYVLDAIENSSVFHEMKHQILTEDDIDAFLFTHLPVQKGDVVKEKLQNIFMRLPGLSTNDHESIQKIISERFNNVCSNRVYTSKELQDVVKGILCVSLKTTSTVIDFHQAVIDAFRSLELALPQPIIFADTNWVKDYFAFLVNPGSLELELWRTDYIGSIGAPMSMWKHWLDASHKSPTWGVYDKPQEYIFI